MTLFRQPKDTSWLKQQAETRQSLAENRDKLELELQKPGLFNAGKNLLNGTKSQLEDTKEKISKLELLQPFDEAFNKLINKKIQLHNKYGQHAPVSEVITDLCTRIELHVKDYLEPKSSSKEKTEDEKFNDFIQTSISSCQIALATRYDLQTGKIIMDENHRPIITQSQGEPVIASFRGGFSIKKLIKALFCNLFNLKTDTQDVIDTFISTIDNEDKNLSRNEENNSPAL